MAKPEVLRELLRSTIRANPKASEKEIHDICLSAAMADKALSAALFEYWFDNSYRDFTIEEVSPHSSVLRANQRSYTRQVSEPDGGRVVPRPARAVEVEQLKEQMKICLLDFALSDGTQLRFATFGQCAREGSWLSAIAKCGSSNEIVGKKLSEADLQNLLKRFHNGVAA